MTTSVTKTVAASPETVWAVLTDHEGMSAWAPGLTVRLTTTGAPARNGIGAVREIRHLLPAPTIVEEVTVFEPNRRFAYRALSGVPLRNYHGDVQLTPTDPGTTITYRIHADQRLPIVDQLLTRAIATTLLHTLVRQIKKGT